MIYLVLTKTIKDTLLLAFHPWHCSGLKNVESEMEIFHSWDSYRIVSLVVVDLVVLIEPPVWGVEGQGNCLEKRKPSWNLEYSSSGGASRGPACLTWCVALCGSVLSHVTGLQPCSELPGPKY